MNRWISILGLLVASINLQAQFRDSLPAGTQENNISLEEQLITAQTTSQSTQRSDYTSEKITVKKFDEKKWREVTGSHDYNDNRKRKSTELQSGQGGSSGSNSGMRRNDRDYGDDYEEEEEDDSESINLGWLGPIFRILFYGAAIAIIVVIIYQIIRNTSFRRNPKRTLADTQDPNDVHDISELDTESLLHKAHLAGDYRMAIRLYFLQLLKKLNENGTIVWAKDKTNRDYLSELFNKRYYFDEIRKLTFAYERVWYGEQMPTPELYDQLSSEFRDIDQKLNSVAAS